MADPRILIGQFMAKRAKNPDGPNDQFAPGGQIVPAKDFLETDVIKNLTPDLPPAPLPRAQLPKEPAPPLNLTSPAAEQPHPESPRTTISPEQPHPSSPLTHIAPETPHPDSPRTHISPEQPHPDSPLTHLAPETPHPNSPHSPPPADPIAVPQTPHTVPAGPQPPQLPGTPVAGPFQPAPPLTTPAPIAFQPAPPLSTPGTVPAPPAVTLTNPAAVSYPPIPALGKPSPTVGEGKVAAQPTELGTPDYPKLAPSHQLEANRDINDQASPGGKLGPVLPEFRQYAPGGQIDPARVPAFDQRLAAADAGIKAVLAGIGDGYTTIPIGAPGGAGFSKGLVGGVKTPFGTQGDMSLDPILFGKNVARLGSHLGAAGLAIFAAEQFALYSLNIKGRIWNPLVAVPPPLIQNFIKPALDVQIPSLGGLLGDDPPDRHLDMAKGTYSVDRVLSSPPFFDRQDQIGYNKGGGAGGALSGFGKAFGADSPIGVNLSSGPLVGSQNEERLGGTIADVSVPGPIVVRALQERNAYSPGGEAGGKDGKGTNTYPSVAGATNKVAIGIDEIIDKIIDNATPANSPIPNRIVIEKIGGVDYSRLTSIFESKPNNIKGVAGEQRIKKGMKTFSIPDKLKNSAFAQGIIPVKFEGENEFGFVTTKRGEKPSNKISDDKAYVPLSFTDLRPIGGADYRTVFFRPFITNFSEDFSPEWNKQSFFGRTDPVATYQGTGRTIQLGFKIVAFGPEDIKTIYQKLNWLTSMVYPEYSKDLSFKSGPVVRMRIGDVINAVGPEGSRGLPGIIEGLSFDYNEALWELKSDFKVPRNINVSLTFHVLHDKPIGLVEGKFGGIGKFDNGKYVPPNGEDNTDKDQIDSFRLVGGDKAKDFMDFKK